MIALRFWLRSGSARWMMLAGVGAGIFVLTSRGGWFWDHASAASWAVTSTVLLGPLVAGLVAHDTWRASTPTMTAVRRQSRRGGRAGLAPAGAVLVAALCAFAVTVVTAHVTVAVVGGGGSPAPLGYVQGVCALVASAGLGLLTGRFVPGFLTGPLAACLGYLLPIGLNALGASEVMVLRGGSLPLAFLDVPASAAAAQMLAAVGLTAVGALVVALTVPRRAVQVAAVSVGAALLVGGLLWSGRVGEDGAPRELGAYQCLDGTVVVCAPSGAGRLVEIMARDLGDAAGDLGRAGLDVSGTTLELVVGDAIPATGRGMLTVPPGMGVSGLDAEDVVAMLATPVACAQLRAEEPPMAMLGSARSLGSWMFDRLTTQDPGTPEERESARAVHGALARCEEPPPFEYERLEDRRDRGR